MPTLSDMTRFLIEKGVALDVALGASEIAEQVMKEERLAIIASLSPQKSADTQAERRREKDRIRARLRLRKSAENPQNSADCCTTALVPQVKNLSSCSKVSKKEERKEESIEALASSSPQKSADKSKRGTRLPSDWLPSDPDFANEILRDRAPTELANFRDYWTAQPGQRGLKLDWDATWRRWVRTASERSPRQQGGHRNGGSLIASIDRELAEIRQERANSELSESNLFQLSFGPVRGS